MEHPTKLMEMSEVRGIVARFVRDEPAPYGDLQVASDTIQTMRQEAAKYGLTAADVVGLSSGPCSKRSGAATARHAKDGAVKCAEKTQST